MRYVVTVGINDADYVTNKCLYYKRWKSILERCYSQKVHKKQKYYEKCEMSSDWLLFSNFKKWMELQSWKDCDLDKDLFSNSEHKIYSKETCVFIPPFLNSFITLHDGCSSNYVGVSYNTQKRKYTAGIWVDNKRKHLGYYHNPLEAHRKWQESKIKLFQDVLEKYNKSIYKIDKVSDKLIIMKQKLEYELGNKLITTSLL